MNGAAGKYLFRDLGDNADVRREIKNAWKAKRQARLALGEGGQAATSNAPTRPAPALRRNTMRC